MSKPTSEEIRELEAEIAEVVFKYYEVRQEHEEWWCCHFEQPMQVVPNYLTDARDWEVLVDELITAGNAGLVIHETTDGLIPNTIYSILAEGPELCFDGRGKTRTEARYQALKQALPYIKEMIDGE